MFKLESFITKHHELIQPLTPFTSQEILGVCTPEAPATNHFIFISHRSQMGPLEQAENTAWIVSDKLWQEQEEPLRELAQTKKSSLFKCNNFPLAMATLLPYFDPRPSLLAFPEGVSPQSWIDPSAQLGPQVRIGPFTCIGPRVKIGQGTIIGPHCTIEGEVEIGENCYLESHVFIGRQSRIGNDCRLKPFSSIGSDGYGYAPAEKGPQKIPQIGITVLEDGVDVGSGACIDRATLTETRIGKGTKIDNLVHIAHNCQVGKYCFITAGFAMAGSSKIGDFFMTGGTSAVSDHVVIADKVTLAGASVVTSDIKESGAYGGNPLLPMQDYLRVRSSIGTLPKIRKQIQKILKHLQLEDL